MSTSKKTVTLETVNHIDKYLKPGSILATDYRIIIRHGDQNAEFMIDGTHGIHEALHMACGAFEIYLNHIEQLPDAQAARRKEAV